MITKDSADDNIIRKEGVVNGSNKALNTVFGKQEYWEGRFEEEEEYDWLVKYNNVRELIIPYLKTTDKILIVGCGNSSFSLDLYDDGFHNITNIDYSLVLIDKMRAAHQVSRPKMQWVHMDMTALSFADGEFDVVLDKAAMDALMVDEGDVWYPNEKVVRAADAMCRGVRRVLKNGGGGVFMQISFAQAHFRTKYLMGLRADEDDAVTSGAAPPEVNPYQSHSGESERYQWRLSSQTISVEGGCLNSFLYTMITL